METLGIEIKISGKLASGGEPAASMMRCRCRQYLHNQSFRCWTDVEEKIVAVAARAYPLVALGRRLGWYRRQSRIQRGSHQDCNRRRRCRRLNYWENRQSIDRDHAGRSGLVRCYCVGMLGFLMVGFLMLALELSRTWDANGG